MEEVSLVEGDPTSDWSGEEGEEGGGVDAVAARKVLPLKPHRSTYRVRETAPFRRVASPILHRSIYRVPDIAPIGREIRWRKCTKSPLGRSYP